jgi:glutamine synthetase
MEKGKGDVLKIVQDKRIKTIQLWFVDILGTLKCVSITPKELESNLNHGTGFDVTSIAGFSEAEESDIVVIT